MLQKSIMDTRPDLKWLKLSELYVPLKYQRVIEGSASLRNIEHIQRDFNWGECGTLLVCKLKKDNEKYAVVDGQHRLRAAELRDDIDELPCVVISPRDLREQAQTFININSRRASLNQLQFHKASLIAGDPIAVELDRILTEAAVVVPNYPVMIYHAAPDMYQGLGKIRKMLTQGEVSPDNIIWAFKAVRAAYPKKNGALRYNMIRALIRWIEKHPATGKNEIVNILRNLDPDTMDLEARKMKMGGEKTLWKAYVTLMERERVIMSKQKVA